MISDDTNIDWMRFSIYLIDTLVLFAGFSIFWPSSNFTLYSSIYSNIYYIIEPLSNTKQTLDPNLLILDDVL